MAAISEGEVAVYDRQLRLWGVQAQQRLLKSKVLVWGLEGSSVEVCKNLVLAGVSLVVRDHRSVEVADVGFNYFLREGDIGRNRAECAAMRIQEMNPLSTVAASAAGPEECGDAAALRKAMKEYDFVCVALGVLGWDFDRACAIDAACRDACACFVLTLGCGELAFFISDLNEHTVHELSSAQGAGAQGTAAPPPSGEQQQGSATGLETIHFPAFAEWLACSPAALQQQKADAAFILLALFATFVREGAGGAGPGPAGAAKFEDYCRNSAKCVPAVGGISDLQDAYRCFWVEPLVHVASVLGGLLAQEVIKAITKKDPPLVNCVCFNAHTCAALVERIPAPQTAAKKRKVEEVADLLD